MCTRCSSVFFAYAQERKLLNVSPVSFRRPTQGSARSGFFRRWAHGIYRAALQMGTVRPHHPPLHPYGHATQRSGASEVGLHQLTLDRAACRALQEWPAAFDPESHPRAPASADTRNSDYCSFRSRAVFNDWHGKAGTRSDRWVSDWVIHDIRRYFSSTLASLSVPIENH